MRLGTNIHAMQAYTSLNRADKIMAASNKRLTTGIKINSAGDDPPRLTTATKLKTQIAGGEKAQQNSSNAISMIQTAEGALSSINSMVQRMRELAVQAANDTNSDSDRLKMQEEINQLNKEIDETIRKADYNGVKLLNGDAAPLEYKYKVVPSGDDTRSTLTLGTTALDGTLKGTVTFTYKDLLSSTQTIMELELTGTETTEDIMTMLLDEIANEGDLLRIVPPGATDYRDLQAIESTDTGQYFKLTVSGNASLLNALGLSSFSGATYERGQDGGVPNLITRAEDLRSPLSDEAVIVKVNPGDPADPYYEIKDNMFEVLPSTVPATYDYGFKYTVRIDSLPPDGEINLFSEISTNPFVIQVGAQNGMEMDISIPKISSAILGADRVNLTSTEFAVSSIALLDRIISDVVDMRATVGSFQVRLEHTIGTLEKGQNALSSSLSRIFDTDLAVEMSIYTQQNVIIQASLSVIAQSNQRPAEVTGLFNK